MTVCSFSPRLEASSRRKSLRPVWPLPLLEQCESSIFKTSRRHVSSVGPRTTSVRSKHATFGTRS